MRTLVFDTPAEASQKAFELVRESLENGSTTFGLATGSTPEKLYELIVASDLDFSQASSINLDEYYGLTKQDPESYAYFMKKHLISHKPFKNVYIPDGEAQDIDAELARYDKIIEENPIDLQILGIGNNGHIGFNEPPADFNGRTQFIDLDQSTIEANARLFDSIDEVPTKALTMGIKSIMDSKKIILMAFGEEKARAVQKLIEGPVDPMVPASVLQNHPDVVVLLDKASAQFLA